MMSKLIFCTEYFRSDEAERRDEIDQCLKYNLTSGNFDEHLIFLETDIPGFVPAPRVRIIKTGSRLTYSRFLKEAVDRDIVYVLANADIMFSSGTEYFRTLPAGEMWAITRHEKDGLLHKPARESQDTWAIRGGDWREFYEECEINLGRPGCENAFAGRLHHGGVRVNNYCFDIKTMHLHRSEKRKYVESDRISRPYYLPSPQKIPWTLKLRAYFQR